MAAEPADDPIPPSGARGASSGRGAEPDDDIIDWDHAREVVLGNLTGSDGFLLVFLLSLASLFLLQTSDSLPAGTLLAVVVTVAATVLAIHRSHAPRWWYRTGIVLGVLTAVASAVERTLVEHDAPGALSGAGALLYAAILALTLPAVLGAAFWHRRITLNTVLATLSAFLLLALLFAATIRAVDLLTDEPYFAQTDEASSSDYVYFSVVTLTTLGYGDLSPANGLGRGIATLEALGGQVFLVTAVALTVGRLGTERHVHLERVQRRRQRRRHQADDDDDEATDDG